MPVDSGDMGPESRNSWNGSYPSGGSCPWVLVAVNTLCVAARPGSAHRARRRHAAEAGADLRELFRIPAAAGGFAELCAQELGALGRTRMRRKKDLDRAGIASLLRAAGSP